MCSIYLRCTPPRTPTKVFRPCLGVIWITAKLQVGARRITVAICFLCGELNWCESQSARQAAYRGIMAMLKVEMAPTVVALLLIATPTVADVTSELARCQIEAERLYPTPPNKGAQNWADRAANLQKRAVNIETCMRAAGYRVTAECSAPLKTYESCMKIADEVMRGPSRAQYHDVDWNKICLDNEWDVRTQERLSASCYQSRSWWRWLGH